MRPCSARPCRWFAGGGVSQAMHVDQVLSALIIITAAPSRLITRSEGVIRAFLTLVGQQIAGLDRCEHPAGGALHGNAEVTACGIFHQLRQDLDIHLQTTRFVLLERPVGGVSLGRAWPFGQPMALEQSL